MPFVLIAAASVYAYITHPQLYAWNATGFRTLWITGVAVLAVTVYASLFRHHDQGD